MLGCALATTLLYNQVKNAYKYRSGSNELFERDIRSLKENELYLSSIEELNDVMEAKVMLDEKSLQVGRILKYIPWFKYSDGIKKQENKFINAMKSYISNKNSWGIYSLSQTYKHKSLWGNYSSSYSGFCIEYDLDILLSTLNCDTRVVDVIYQNEVPIIDLGDLNKFHKDNNWLYPKIIGTKSTEWNSEEEIRIISSKQGLVKYSEEAVIGIYLGPKMEQEKRSIILNMFSDNEVNIYEIAPCNNSYDLERKLIQ